MPGRRHRWGCREQPRHTERTNRERPESRLRCEAWECRLLCGVSRRQYFVRIDSHNKIDDLVRGDFAEPVRRVRRNDNDIAGSDLAAHTTLNAGGTGAGTVEHGHNGVLGRDLPWTVQRPAGYECPSPFNHMVDLGNLGVFDAAGSVFAGSFGAMDDTDADVVLAVDINDANGLIADTVGGCLLHQRLHFRAADVRGGSAWQVRSRTGRLRLKIFRNGNGDHKCKREKSKQHFAHDALLRGMNLIGRFTYSISATERPGLFS